MSLRTLTLSTTLLASLFALPAMACEDDCPMMLKKAADGSVAPATAHDHGGHMGHTSNIGSGAGADMNAMTRELDAAMAAMHKNMAVPYTGDADLDFLRGMIPHHQGAVEMAKIQLKYGQDSQVKRLAREIIRAQEYEIGLMQRWVKQLEAKQQGPGADKGWLGRH